MVISVKDADDVTREHIPDRIEVDLVKPGGKIEEIELKVYFKVKTILPNDNVVGEPYLDFANPLLLNCKGNSKLTEAMLVVQEAIGMGRYQQITEISEPMKSLEAPILLEQGQSDREEPLKI